MNNHKYKYVPRHPALQAINGHKFMSVACVDLDKIPCFVLELFKANNWNIEQALLTGYICLDGKNKLKTSKLLSRAYIPEAIISQTMAAVSEPIELTISSRFKDFINITHTRHYTSCISKDGSNNQTIKKLFLAHSMFGIIYARDKRGEFLSRTICRVYEHKTLGNILIINPVTYGKQVKFPDTIGNLPCFLPLTHHKGLYSDTDEAIQIALTEITKPSRDKIYDDLQHKAYTRYENAYIIKPSIWNGIA